MNNLFMIFLGIVILIFVALLPGEQVVIAMGGGALLAIGAVSWYEDRKDDW